MLFDGLTLNEAAILATMLAATDAALGKAVITNEAVPARIREGLNVESGLNNGLCVPVLLFFIAMASSAGAVHSYVAKELESISGIRVRVIERDKAQAERAAEQLKRTVILNGDAMDARLYRLSGIVESSRC